MQKRVSVKMKQVVEAAGRLFLENGFVAVSMDAVAQEAGVTKQTVYRYYRSKEKLFEAVQKSLAASADWNEPGRFEDPDTDYRIPTIIIYVKYTFVFHFLSSNSSIHINNFNTI